MPDDGYRHRRFGFWPDRVVHPAQGALIWALYGAARLLPVDWASGLGGLIGRAAGPLLSLSRRADANLRAALPDLDAAGRRRVIRAMWDNLGRVVFEYPHLAAIVDGGRIVVDDRSGLAAPAPSDRPLVFFGAHLGNWELLAPLAVSRGIPLSVVYRTPNNRFADRLVRRMRQRDGLTQIRKGSNGNRETLRLMRGGGTRALLVDQKFTDGLAIPFFGRPAMTAPAVGVFALRHGARLVPARVERIGGARFRVTIYPPLPPAPSVEAILTGVNALIETWVRDRPEQWLWIHRRWPS